MNEKDFMEVVRELLVVDTLENTIRTVKTFQEEGFPAQNTGLIIETESGARFQIFINRL